MKKTIKILNILGIMCFIYVLAIYFFMGYGSKFFLVWGVIGAFFIVIAFLLKRKELYDKIPLWIKRICIMLFAACMVFFLVVEGIIVSGFKSDAKSGADYCIILGAQWNKSGPSYVLKKRLDKAVEYLNDNPDTIAIASGGKGSNEHVSEAEGMESYLIDAGIDADRIIKEDKSTNTSENLIFSAKLMNVENDRVVIVSNNFHEFRAKAIAKKQGYKYVEGLAAGSFPAMLPNNMLREFVGVIKDYLFGNL